MQQHVVIKRFSLNAQLQLMILFTLSGENWCKLPTLIRHITAYYTLVSAEAQFQSADRKKHLLRLN